QHDLGTAGLFGGLAGYHDRRQDVRHADLGHEVAMRRVPRKPKRKPPPVDEAAIRKGRRLLARAATGRADDRAQVLALVGDIETVRNRLLAECVRLDEEMKRSSVRITALRAYAHGAMAIRGRRH